MKKSFFPAKPILLIDDEEPWLVSLEMLLARNGIDNLVPCSDGSQVMALLAEQEFSLVLLDYGMPDVSGAELLEQMVLLYPQLPVVILTGFDQVDTAIKCKDMGAFHYLVKTQGVQQLVDSILETLRRATEIPAKTYEFNHPELFADVIAESAGMQTACLGLDAAIENQQPLLLVGEKGVGKKFLAGKLMAGRDGSTREFEAEAIDQIDLLDDAPVQELLAETRGGQIYLENIAALSPASQLKLLKLLQQKPAVRLVMTLTDLQQETTGIIRADLLHLLQLQMVTVPPLRDRKADLADLTQLFLRQAAEEYNKKTPTPPPELDLLLQSYVFPGNVAELRAMVFTAVKAHRARKMSMDSFKQAMAPGGESLAPGLEFSEVLPTIDEAVSMLIDEAERRTAGNQSIMAEMLGISRQALNKRLVRRKKQA